MISVVHRFAHNHNRPTEDNGVKIVAVDLQLMAPISGVIQIHGDITKVYRASAILGHGS